MPNIIDIIIHLDKYLDLIFQSYGNVTYLLIFIIIFLETGFVLTPFLPGDSLLFVVGTFAAKGSLNVFLLLIFISLAAILGDTVNYFAGNYFGEKVFSKSRFFKQEYLERTKEFYKKHGRKTIILARFIPIIRTFAPFVAGVGKMSYKEFLAFNIIGGISWVALFLFAGFFFGEIPIIRENLTLVILLIVVASFIPPILEFIKSRNNQKS